MATGKKFYWIKLKEQFMTGDEVDFLMSQKNGSQYVVLYLMLCMICVNTDGKLSKHIGEIIIPIDIDKIQRDCKYFSRETVIVAIELFKKIGLIYEEGDGLLAISHYEELVGSETDYAAKKRRQRSENSLLGQQNVDNVYSAIGDNTRDNVPIENRDKRLEIRNNIESSDIKPKRKRFVAPTIDELNNYAREKGYTSFNAERFHDYYESNGWKVGRNPMKDWKAAVRNWVAKDKETPQPQAKQSGAPNRFHNFEQRTDDLDAMLRSGAMWQHDKQH